MEQASFGRTTGRKGQKGAPLEVQEVDHVGRKISLEPKLSIKFSTEISEIFGIMKSTPDAVFHPTSRQSEVCLQGSVNVTTIVPRNFRVITGILVCFTAVLCVWGEQSPIFLCKVTARETKPKHTSGKAARNEGVSSSGLNPLL